MDGFTAGKSSTRLRVLRDLPSAKRRAVRTLVRYDGQYDRCGSGRLPRSRTMALGQHRSGLGRFGSGCSNLLHRTRQACGATASTKIGEGTRSEGAGLRGDFRRCPNSNLATPDSEQCAPPC